MQTEQEQQILRLQLMLADIHRAFAVEGSFDEFGRSRLHAMVMAFPEEARKLLTPPPPPPPVGQ